MIVMVFIFCLILRILLFNKTKIANCICSLQAHCLADQSTVVMRIAQTKIEESKVQCMFRLDLGLREKYCSYWLLQWT